MTDDELLLWWRKRLAVIAVLAFATLTEGEEPGEPGVEIPAEADLTMGAPGTSASRLPLKSQHASELLTGVGLP